MKLFVYFIKKKKKIKLEVLPLSWWQDLGKQRDCQNCFLSTG